MKKGIISACNDGGSRSGKQSGRGVDGGEGTCRRRRLLVSRCRETCDDGLFGRDLLARVRRFGTVLASVVILVIKPSCVICLLL